MAFDNLINIAIDLARQDGKENRYFISFARLVRTLGAMDVATIEIGEECSSPIFNIGEEFLTNLRHW